jgi:predicted ATPase
MLSSIGSCQCEANNEVSANHPFMLAIKEQGKLGLAVRDIHLEPLAVADVAKFVADALRQSAAAARPLAEIVHRKTGGNPFFMRQFLHALHDSKLIFFDSEAHGFRYDTAAIGATSITENVAQFLAAKLDKLGSPAAKRRCPLRSR